MSVHRLAVVVTCAALVAVDAGTAGSARAAGPDPTYPTGTFAVEQNPGMLTGYAGCLGDPQTGTSVSVTSLLDDNTPSDRIRLSLDVTGGPSGVQELRPYGAPDGETKGIDGWSVIFDAPGSYVPTVTITDQDAHETVMTLPSITVVDDPTPPKVRLRLPPVGQRQSVTAWRTLRGTAADPESALYDLTAEALQRRRGTWYAYDGRARVWRKGNRSESWTRDHVRRFDLVTQRFVDGRWAMPRLSRLTRGLLVVRTQVTHDGSCASGFAPEVRVQLRKR